MSRQFRIRWAALGLLTGIVCAAILYRQIDFKQAASALARLNGRLLLLPAAVMLINLLLRALRWRFIFPPMARPRFSACLTTLGIGNMANFILPGRAGDFARCVLLDETASLHNSSRTLGTLAVEKVLDGITLIAAVLLAAQFLAVPPWLFTLLRVAALLFGATVVLLIAVRYKTRWLTDSVRSVFALIHLSSLERKFDGLLTSFSEGLSVITSWWTLLFLSILTISIWTTEAALVWGLAAALGLAVPLKTAMIAAAVLGLGLMIPAAPGGLGTYELLGTEAFKIAGVAVSSALVLTAVVHAWVFVMNIAMGLVLLLARGLSVAQLRNRLQAESELETAA